MATLAESNAIRAFYEKDGEHVAVDLTFHAPISDPADGSVEAFERMLGDGLCPVLIAASVHAWAERCSCIASVSIAAVGEEYWIVVHLSAAIEEHDNSVRSSLNPIRSLFHPFFAEGCFIWPDHADNGFSDLPGSWCVYPKKKN